MLKTTLALLIGAVAGLQVSLPVVPRASCAVRRSLAVMQEDDEGPTLGISGVLGGGKTSDQVEKSTAAELGSLAAFVVVLAGITFGALNPDAIEDIANSNSKCVQGKIVKGVKQQCNADGTYIR